MILNQHHLQALFVRQIRLGFALLASVWGAAPHAAEPLKALIITGENNHDWKATTPVLKTILESSGRFEVDVLENPWEEITGARFAPYGVLVLNFNPTSDRNWTDAQRAVFLDAVGMQGKGLLVIHAANNAFAAWKDYETVLGGAWRSSGGHGSFHSFQVDLLDREHPITRGFPKAFAHAADELYHGLTLQPGVRLLAVAFSSKAKSRGTDHYEPVAWVLHHGRGRVFHTTLGHAASSMESDGFKSLLQRGGEWAATGEVTIPPAFAAWQPLTNGKDLSGWVGDPGVWRLADGVITGETQGLKRNSFLRTERRYADFTLKVGVRLVPDDGNSGLQFRSEWLPDGEMYGYQADIGKGWWGSLYDESTGRKMLVPSYAEKGSRVAKKNDWNDYEIEVVKNKIRITLNGTVTAEYEDSLSRPDGHVAVQVHSGGPLKVEFRDLMIQEKN